MMNDNQTRKGLVTVFGGSGFIGRHVVRALIHNGWRVKIACRRPELAVHLQSDGKPGQIELIQANLRDARTIAAALEGVDAAVNLVGILTESDDQTFADIQSRGARAVAEAVKEAGITRFIHISAIGARKNSPSGYARSKPEGEAAVHELVPQAIIFRPSIVFGPEDDFFNRFAAMARLMPILPLVGASTRFQPVFVDDIAQAIVHALDGKATPGATYELGGPEVKTFRELVQYVCDVTRRRRYIISLGFETGKLMAGVTQIAGKLSLGLFPKMLSMTTDQVGLLRRDNVVSDEAKAAGMTLEGLGVAPQPIAAIIPAYLDDGSRG
ncbi:complex I NDUFA9 subunit family protein [Methylocystis hirsuta]|uniref:Complex I NDUFA9 subunit family protein n=2 Tax=Methylocystis hirsuta TaxID=369798 RepID=A0A3M9XKA4_9HYPH|nr:complex I NDUFA9 subunit family protein [Methylocystis hirsuta]